MTDASAALLLAVDSWGGVASMITLAESLHGLGTPASPRTQTTAVRFARPGSGSSTWACRRGLRRIRFHGRRHEAVRPRRGVPGPGHGGTPRGSSRAWPSGANCRARASRSSPSARCPTTGSSRSSPRWSTTADRARRTGRSSPACPAWRSRSATTSPTGAVAWPNWAWECLRSLTARQHIEHGIVDEQLAVSFPRGQREAKHRAHRLLPRPSVLVLGGIGRQRRLRLVPAGQDAVADLAGVGDGKRPARSEQRQLPGHRRRAEPRVVEYLGGDLRASPRRRAEPAVGERPVAAERRPVRQPQAGQDERQLDRPQCRRGAEVPGGVGLLDLRDARRAQTVSVDQPGPAAAPALGSAGPAAVLLSPALGFWQVISTAAIGNQISRCFVKDRTTCSASRGGTELPSWAWTDDRLPTSSKSSGYVNSRLTSATRSRRLSQWNGPMYGPGCA